MTEEIKKASHEDVEKNKAMAIVGYIIPILFFIPLISEDGKKSPFAKFHANQQLNVLLFLVVGQMLGAILAVILIGILILFVVWVGYIAFLIMGIMNVSNGEMKELPVIGGIKLIT
jgi:uncharacterized membrane protein